MAILAKQSKHEKYLDLDQCHIFTRQDATLRRQVPLGLKPSGELACCLKQVTGETKSFSYLQQCLSIAVQWGNAATVMGSMESTTSPFDFFP